MIVLNLVGKGTYHRAYALGRELGKRQHEVTLIATSENTRFHVNERESDGVKIVASPDLLTGPLRSGWDPWNTLRRIAWINGRPFDVVHAFQSRPVVIYPALAAHRKGASLIMDWSDWFGRGGSVEERPNPLVRTVLRPVETYYEEHFLPRADGVVVISRTLQAKAEALGVPRQSILLAGHGSEFENAVQIPIPEARTRLGFPPETFLIGYVGRIFQKDAELMVQAFEKVSQQIKEAKLLVAGYCPIDIRRMAACPESIIQTGPLDTRTLYDYLSACDIFWLPMQDTNANRGRWPSKINDYMATGRPTVATQVGDIADLLKEEEIGLLSSDQPDAFATQTALLYANAILRVTMGRRARQLAETRFTWGQQASQLIDFYTSVLKQ